MVIFGSSLLLQIVNIVYALYHWYKVRRGTATTQFTFFCEDIIYGLPKLLFQEVFDHNGQRLALHGREVPRSIVFFFFGAAALVLGCAFITFWSVFLIDETFACDPGLDCYPVTDDDDKKPLQHTPITDCSEFDTLDNVTIFCYQFVFRYAEGFGAAGGLVTFSILLFKLCAMSLFWFIDTPMEGCCGKVKMVVGTLIIIIVFGLSPLWSFVVLIVVTSVPIFTDAILKTDQSTLQFLAYWFALSYGSIFAIYGLMKLAKEPIAHSGSLPIFNFIHIVIPGQHPTDGNKDSQTPSASPEAVNPNPLDAIVKGQRRSTEQMPLLRGRGNASVQQT